MRDTHLVLTVDFSASERLVHPRINLGPPAMCRHASRTATAHREGRRNVDGSGRRMPMMQIGVVGTASFYGPDYARRITERGDASVVGVVPDPNVSDATLKALGRPTPEELTTTADCSLCESVAELLATDPDGIVVASPTTRRADDAVTVLETDTPVLTAKPAAVTAADARRIAAAAERAGTPALTTTPARFDTAIREGVERIQRGDIGDPVSATTTIRHDRVPKAGIEANAEHAPDQAGSVLAMGYYTADLLRWAVDSRIDHVSGWVRNANTPHSSHPDTGVATAEHGTGVVSTMRMLYATDCRERLGNWELEVVGTDGVIRTSHIGYEGIQWSAGSPTERTANLFGRDSSPVLDRQLSAFIEAIRTRTYPAIVPGPRRAADALATCEAWADGPAPSEPER